MHKVKSLCSDNSLFLKVCYRKIKRQLRVKDGEIERAEGRPSGNWQKAFCDDLGRPARTGGSRGLL